MPTMIGFIYKYTISTLISRGFYFPLIVVDLRKVKVEDMIAVYQRDFDFLKIDGK
jgi:hypothetical protein